MRIPMDGDNLIELLLKNPVDFNARGRGNELLNCYWGGFPIESLRPLLTHRHDEVREAAMFVATELGTKASPLINDIVPLVDDPDPSIAWDAIESVCVCSLGSCARYFTVVVRQLENTSSILRRLAMRLLSRVSEVQIRSAVQYVGELGPSAPLHLQGLLILIPSEIPNENAIRSLLTADSELIQCYGAIGACRYRMPYPMLLQEAVLSTNPNVSEFAKDALDE